MAFKPQIKKHGQLPQIAMTNIFHIFHYILCTFIHYTVIRVFSYDINIYALLLLPESHRLLNGQMRLSANCRATTLVHLLLIELINTHTIQNSLKQLHLNMI